MYKKCLGSDLKAEKSLYSIDIKLGNNAGLYSAMKCNFSHNFEKNTAIQMKTITFIFQMCCDNSITT